jgi:cell cycle sensor histidine kinase DivJ
MPYRRHSSRQRWSFGTAPALAWHLGWAVLVLAAGAGLAASGQLLPGLEMAAIGVGASPALIGAGLALSRAGSAPMLAVLVWSLAAAIACLMTGGATGPLAAWCLAPLAAASAFRRPELLAAGAAGSFAAAALACAGSFLIVPPMPDPAAAVWLAGLSLASVAVGLGVGILGLQGQLRGQDRIRDLEAASLRDWLESQPALLIQAHPGGHIVRTFGRGPAGLALRGLPGRNLAELAEIGARPDLEQALRRAAGEGAAEVAFAPAHGGGGWWVLALRRMDDGAVLAALRDATTEKARETELDEAREAAETRSAGKSRFLANMSHELRTPLNAIMGFSDIMRQRLFGPMSDRYAEYAELVHESGAHLLELINDILDMSKIEAERYELAREEFDAREAVSAVLRLMRGQADQADVILRGVLPPDGMEADADRRALKQIALNLISNALKFTPAGGSVTVTLQGAGEVLELIVADTGVGISADDLQRLGRPYEQAGEAASKAAGTGLGLSLVRAFARLHGGEMTLESAVGEGTTVTVRLPVLIDAAARPLAQPVAANS